MGAGSVGAVAAALTVGRAGWAAVAVMGAALLAWYARLLVTGSVAPCLCTGRAEPATPLGLSRSLLVVAAGVIGTADPTLWTGLDPDQRAIALAAGVAVAVLVDVLPSAVTAGPSDTGEPWASAVRP